jgi:acyl-CoA dehydrogenase
MDFTISPEIVELRDRVLAFVRDKVIPQERLIAGGLDLPADALASLRDQARAAGIFAPQVPLEYGGLGLDMRGISVVFEAAGRSLIGPLALNCAAPDEGNMHLLHQIATPVQRERYLRPLAAGTQRSCFAMTEPAPGAGSDPSLLLTSAERHGDRWILNGRKWFISGADGAAFAICMARTADRIDGQRGATMFLIDADNPGFKVVRRIGGLDHMVPGGHCEVLFEDCELGEDAVLGAVGEGFRYAQLRLAPARLTHCMRWLGVAQRAIEIAGDYARRRSSFGKLLAEHQAVQWMAADSAIEMQAARLMIWHAAWLLDMGHPARQETSMAKVFVSETVDRVIDRAVQICGSLGVSDELPLADFYREARAFRIYDGASEVHRMSIARRVLREIRD